MPDRVKEAVFSILGSYYGCAAALPPLQMADMFAGGGTMGLEALSRGGASCSFFERDRVALRTLRQNLATLDVGEAASVVSGDAWSRGLSERNGCRFDLVFLDPPYQDSHDASEQGAVMRYLAKLRAADEQPQVVMLHHHARVDFAVGSDDGWKTLDRRTYGSSGITFFKR